jgi:hypothetical protein
VIGPCIFGTAVVLLLLHEASRHWRPGNEEGALTTAGVAAFTRESSG